MKSGKPLWCVYSQPAVPYLTTVRDLSYFSWLTPMTNMGASALGAEMITLLAPPFK